MINKTRPKPLTVEQIEHAMQRLNGNASVDQQWQLDEGQLYKHFCFTTFHDAFTFMQKIAELAELLDHHPDWCNSYNSVKVRLFTHDVKTLTELDFALAEAMERACSK